MPAHKFFSRSALAIYKKTARYLVSMKKTNNATPPCSAKAFGVGA
jgi:hypothetical protein